MWKIEFKLISSDLTLSAEQIIHTVIQNDGLFLFDNVAAPNSRWQCAGFHPVISIGETVTTFGSDQLDAEPLSLIDELLNLNRQQENIPFITGYLAYDYKDRLEEEGLFQSLADKRMPLLNFKIFEYYLVQSENAGVWQLYQLTFPFAYKLKSLPDFNLLNAETRLATTVSTTTTNFKREQFMAGVEKIQEYIRSGDIYQANLTREISGQTNLSAIELAKKLYYSNRITYGVISCAGENKLISTSPELFFETQGDIIKTSPIKGTVSRSADTNEDEINKNQLLNSPKELAELAMIVDLLRNDLGKICRYDSVTVTDFPLVQALQNVYHLYADITGVLETTSFAKIIKALFPGGSITGCPKIRACQIIEEIEKQGRGAYTGSCGRINFDGSMQFNILIRTLFFYPDGSFSYNVGGGITLKSNPAAEFEETVHKGRTIEKVLNN